MADNDFLPKPSTQEGAISPTERMKWAGWIGGLVFVALVVVLATVIPNPTGFQEFAFRVPMSIGAAAFCAFVPGFLIVQAFTKQEDKQAGICGGGAIVVFLLLMYVNPARLGVPVASLFGVSPSVPSSSETNAAAFAAEQIATYRGEISVATKKWADIYGAEYQKEKANGITDADVVKLLTVHMHEEVKTNCDALAGKLDTLLPLPDSAKWEPLFIEAYGPFRQYTQAIVEAYAAGTLSNDRETVLEKVQPTLDRLQSLYEYARKRAANPDMPVEAPPKWDH